MPRNVWVLSLVAFLVMLGYGVVFPVLPVFARSFGVSTMAAGAVISTFALTKLLTGPWCGKVIHLLSERKTMAVGITVVALSSAGTGLAQSYWQMLFMRGAGGIGSAMFSVAAMSLLLASVPTEKRGRASAMFSGGFLLGGMTGPALGGLFAGISVRAPFFFYAFTLLLSGAVAMLLLQQTNYAEKLGEQQVTSFASAVKQARFRAACLTNFAAGWQSQGARSTLIPVYVVEVLNRKPVDTGIAFAISMVVQGIMLAPVGKAVDQWGRKKILVAGLLVAAVTSACFAVSPHMWALTLALCCYGISSACLATAPTAVVGDVTGGRGGSAVATFQMSADFGLIVAPLAVGFLADHFGMLTAFGIGSVILLVIAIWSMQVRIDPEQPSAAPANSDNPQND